MQESILFPLLRSNVKSHSEIDKRRSNTVKKHQRVFQRSLAFLTFNTRAFSTLTPGENQATNRAKNSIQWIIVAMGISYARASESELIWSIMFAISRLHIHFFSLEKFKHQRRNNGREEKWILEIKNISFISIMNKM